METKTVSTNIKEKRDLQNRVYPYVLRLVRFSCSLPRDVVTREITRQLIRSGSSVGANYFEARSASSRKDYINYFNHSLKSANETKFWLAILSDGNLIPKEFLSEKQWLEKETKELANIIASSILTLKAKDS